MAATASVTPTFSVEMFIDAIKEHPILYDKSHLNFKDVAYKDQLWEKIGKEMGVSGSLCQKKFKNLKDTFMKIRNQIRTTMKSGAGAADVTTIKWKHFPQMQAIMEPVSRDPMLYSSLDFAPSQENQQDHAELPGTSSSSVQSSGPATPVTAATESHLVTNETADECDSDIERTPRPKKARQSPRRQQSPSKAPQHAAVAAACMEHLQLVRTDRQQRHQHQREPQDAVHHICMALAAQLRTLNQRDQCDTIFEIQTLIYHKMQRAMNEDESN